MPSWLIRPKCVFSIFHLLNLLVLNIVCPINMNLVKSDGSSRLNATLIECHVNLESFKESHSNLIHDDEFQIQCQLCNPATCYVVGTSMYTPESSICCSAIHDGKITQHVSKAKVVIHNQQKRRFVGSTQNNIRSYSYTPQKKSYFSFASLAESTSTTTPMWTVTDIAKTLTTTPKNSEANKSSSTISSNIQNNGNITVSTSLPRSVSHISTSASTNGGKIKLHLSSAEGPTIMYPISLPDAQEPKSPESSSMYKTTVFQVFVALCGVLVLVGLVITGILVYRCRRSNWTWRLRTRSAPQEERCVCYVNPTSSKQSMLYDPETCDRPCSVKAQKQLLICSDRLDSNCTSCEDKCNASKFEF